MKRFFLSVLAVSIFFLGLGALVEKTGAKFKSDERALELVRKARQAIGGDAAIAGIESMVIVGRSSQKIRINGVESTEDGETEIAMQLPDKMTRMVKVGKGDGKNAAHSANHSIVTKDVDVVVLGDVKDKMEVRIKREGHGAEAGAVVNHKIVIKKDDGTVQELTGEEAAKWIAEHPIGEGKRTLHLKKADGTVGEYDATIKSLPRKTEGGTATFTTKDGKTFNIEGHDIRMAHTAMAATHGGARDNELLRTTLSLLLTSPKGMDVEYTYGGEGNLDGTACQIVVASFGGQSYRLFLDNSSSLPVGISYKATSLPRVIKFNHEVGARTDGSKDIVFFKKESGKGDVAEVQVKFSDYRSVNGVQLPFRWTQTGGGDETFNVTSYDINPANIGEKFQNRKVMVRTAKPDGK